MTRPFLQAQPGLRVADLDRAVAFYEKLGFECGYRNQDLHQVMHGGEVTIHLSTNLGGNASFQIMVEDVDPLFALANSLNLEVLFDGLGNRPWGCRDFTIQDPDGNIVTFSQWMGDP